MNDASTRAALPSWMAALGYAGLIPFAACAVLLLALPEAGMRSLCERALLGYGAVILSFLGGVHWGLALRGDPGRGPRMLVIGVIPSLVGWAALLAPFETAAAIQVGAFGAFWLYEHRVLGPAVLPPAYLELRRWLTISVVASLGLALMVPSL